MSAAFPKARLLTCVRGIFRSGARPGDVLRGRESRMACLLSRMSYANSGRVRFSREERRAVLEGILRYYSIHLPGIGAMRSPEVLKEVLG